MTVFVIQKISKASKPFIYCGNFVGINWQGGFDFINCDVRRLTNNQRLSGSILLESV